MSSVASPFLAAPQKRPVVNVQMTQQMVLLSREHFHSLLSAVLQDVVAGKI
jgi:hypothetical protein